MRTVLGLFLVATLSLPFYAQSTVALWHARLADGSDTELTVTQASGQLEFHNQKAVAFSIPAAGVTDIFYMTQRYSRAVRAGTYFEQLCCPDPVTNNGLPPSRFEVNLLPLLAAAIAAPLGNSRDHYVEIRWYHNGQGATTLKLAKDDYAHFLDWLQRETGRKWIDIDQERQQVLDEIAERKAQAFHVSLWDRDFQALPVELHGETQLYFFLGDVKPKNISMIFPVEEEWSDNKCVSGAKALYRPCGKAQCPLDAVLLPITSYRVLSAKPMTIVDSGTAPASDCVLLGQQQKRETMDVQLHAGDQPTLHRRD